MAKRIWFGAIALMVCLANMQAQTQVIAHRGFWKTEGSAQNSITALEKAAEAQVYGSEFDVQMTADGKLVVNHDSSIEGMTVAETPYKQLRTLRIKNGEPLPTLHKYLKRGKKLDIQLILEIKPLPTPEMEYQATTKIVKMVKRMRLAEQVEYISFSMNVCEQLVKLTPTSEIAYLNGDIAPTELKARGINGIDYHFSVFDKHLLWSKEARKLRMTTNAWTVNKDEDIRRVIQHKVMYITTDNPLQVRELLNEAKVREVR